MGIPNFNNFITINILYIINNLYIYNIIIYYLPTDIIKLLHLEKSTELITPSCPSYIDNLYNVSASSTATVLSCDPVAINLPFLE